MIAEFDLTNSFLQTWSQRIWTASWQGGLLLVLAWIICRTWKDLPAAHRCWIWRIAYLKFVAVLMLGGIFQLSILPSSFVSSQPVSQSASQPATDGLLVSSNTDLAANEPNEPRFVAATLTDQPAASTSNVTWPIYQMLFVFWAIGCGWGVVTIIRHQLLARRWVANSTPVKDEKLLRQFRVLCAQLKLSQTPEFAVTTEAPSPVLAFSFQPTILIPTQLLHTCESDELNLVLAHELAHAKRRDLLWNWLPVLVRTCFFFHPMVWLAQPRYSLDQEIACDRLALQCTKAPQRDYGNVLVKVSSASPQPAPTLATLGVASSFKTLKSRILEMHQSNRNATWLTKALSACIIVGGLMAVLPFELAAQQESEKRSERSAAETDDPTIPTVVNGISRNSVRKAMGAKVVSPRQTAGDTVRSTSKSQKQPGNVNVTVNDGDVTESLHIKPRRTGGIDVTFTETTQSGKKIQKYRLKNMDQLKKKDKRAFEFYQNHVANTDTVVQGQGIGGASVATGMGRNGSAGSIKTVPGVGSGGGGGSWSTAIYPGKSQQQSMRSSNSNSSSDQASDSDSQSSSAFQSSSSVSRNGKTRSRQNSRTTGNGFAGGGAGGNGFANGGARANGFADGGAGGNAGADGGMAKLQMINQIEQMIDQTDNPQMKDVLRQLLKDMKNK